MQPRKYNIYNGIVKFEIMFPGFMGVFEGSFCIILFGFAFRIQFLLNFT